MKNIASSFQSDASDAVLRQDGSVYVKLNGRSVHASGCPRKLKEIALTKDGLWAITTNGKLFRWNQKSDDSDWMAEQVPEKARQICTLEDGRLCLLTKKGNSFVRSESKDNQEASWIDDKEVTAWLKPQPEPARLRFQFGIRALLASVLLLALVLAPTVAHYQKSQRWAQAIDVLEAQGATVRYAHEFDSDGKEIANPVEPGFDLLKKWLGKEFFVTPVELTFPYGKDPEVIDSVQHLTTLKRINCKNRTVVDLSPIKNLTQLEELKGDSLYSGDLAFATNLTRLKSLNVNIRSKPDEPVDLSPLNNLQNLESLDLRASNVLDPTPLASLTKLENLKISIKLDNLDVISKLKNLRNLDYCWDKASLHPSAFRQMTNLESITWKPYRHLKSLDWASKLTSLRVLESFRKSIVNTKDRVDFGTKSLVYNLDHQIESYRADLVLSYCEPEDLSDLNQYKTVDDLNLRGGRINDLSPLGKLVKLYSIDLGETQVDDLTPLIGNQKLKTLRLNETPITDLSPLASFPDLSRLEADGTPVSDISSLANLPALNFVELADTNVADLSPLVRPILNSIDVSGTQVTSIAPLADVDELRTLCLYNTRISDLSPLAEVEIYELELDNTDVSNLEALRGKTKLGYLDLSGSKVSDISALSELSLEAVDLSYTKVKDVGVLGTLDQLYSIELTDSLVEKMPPLKRLKELTSIQLAGSQIKDLDWLDELQGGDRDSLLLNLSRTKVSNFSNLSHLKDVLILNLSKTSFADISQLPRRVEHLNLSDSKVADISSLGGISSSLDLSRTAVTDIAALGSSCQNINRLKLSGIAVSNWSALTKFDRLETLDCSATSFSVANQLLNCKKTLRDLDLSHTPVDHLPSLVSFEELTNLKLAGTPIKNLEPISRFLPYGLDELDLTGCPVVDLTPLQQLKGLLHLKLNVSKANDLAPLANMGVLESLLLEEVPRNLDLSLLCEFKYLFELRITGEIGDLSQLNGLYRIKRLHLPAGTKIPDDFLENFPTLRQVFVGEDKVWTWRDRK